MSLEVLNDTQLVGGTALALQLGHRKSIDLDLFGNIEIGEFDIKNPFMHFDRAFPVRRTPNILVYSLDSVKVDIVNYAFPWLEPDFSEDGIRMATLKDIAAMKLNAITGRGTKKDFVDISFLL
ncbi:MAG: nucleotidyl transferase AbiEii/AbiGii toxin family protein [Cyclobacteriaceae bacterium]|nr:nucleotidyl transferase AbiEii/AbiGii toxin family protein [Cyclobacteriaceae bacterium]